jgi:hypothetical protein
MGGEALCVYCRARPVEARFRPFCSERCRLLDLAAWADGTYRIAGEPLPPEEDTEPRQPGP